MEDALHRPQDNHDEIRRLLEAADSPLLRGILGLMSAQQHAIERLVESLNENTEATKTIAETLGGHVSKEEDFQTKVTTFQTSISASYRTTRVVAGLFLGVVCVLGGYIVREHLDAARIESNEQRQLKEQAAVNSNRIATLENQMAEAIKRLGPINGNGNGNGRHE